MKIKLSEKEEIIELIEAYKLWCSNKHETNRERGNVMVAYDMDSRYVAAKQIIEKIQEYGRKK